MTTCAPPRAGLPAGLGRLRALAAALTGATGRIERGLRVIVTVPTLRLAGATAAFGSVMTSPPCTGCEHARLEVGAPVTAWMSGEIVDTHLDGISDRGRGELRYSGLRVVGRRDMVHRLPDGFPARRPTRLDPQVRADAAAAYGCPETAAGQAHVARTTHPVVVAGEPRVFRDDVDLLARTGLALHARARLSAGHGVTDWYRHPVLVAPSVPPPAEIPWAATLRPRLVIVTGAAGWNVSSRNNWPEVPVLVLMSRRSPAASETAAVLGLLSWRPPADLPDTLAPLLRPGDGLEIRAVVEPDVHRPTASSTAASHGQTVPATDDDDPARGGPYTGTDPVAEEEEDLW